MFFTQLFRDVFSNARIFLVPFMTLWLLEAVQAEMTIRTMEHEGVTRHYHVYIPQSYNGSESVPLVMVLHGRGGSGEKTAELSEFNQRADKHNFIVVYPDGIEGTWFYPRGVGGFGEEPNDTVFLMSAIEEVSRHYSLDPARIYVTGISNGGFMAQRLACDAPDIFAAAASVAATSFSGIETICRSRTPVPIVFFHGMADEVVPWSGKILQYQDGTSQEVTYSISRTLDFWSYYNGCGGELTSRAIPQSDQSVGTDVQVYSSSECRSDSEVSLYRINGGGHNWPGVEGVIPEHVAGKTNMDIHASDEMWAFFERHTKKSSAQMK